MSAQAVTDARDLADDGIVLQAIEEGSSHDPQQMNEDALTVLAIPLAEEDAGPSTLGALPDEISQVSDETRQSLDPSGHDLWGGPARIGRLPTPEGASETAPPSFTAVPVA